MHPEDLPLLKAAGLGKSVKSGARRVHEFFFGDPVQRALIGQLKTTQPFETEALKTQAKGLKSKYRIRQALAALGLTGAATSPLAYKALRKKDAR